MGTPDYELTIGQMVGEYRIERKIGEGGFGKVYAAVHPVIGKAAAVKILNPDLAKNAEMVSRFVAEARAVNQIRHRNIIDIFAFGTLPGGLHYFVMELLEGMTLDAYLQKNGPLEPGHALAILWPIARALSAAHKAGITHRDLKPENVFLTFDQDGSIFPKLLDFGIAKLLHESEMAHRTRTGMMMGTPIYMSPEQCRGAHVDTRSDIYSFGIMVHEVLTGSRPFNAENVMDLLMKQITEPAPPMSSSRPGLPRSLDKAVLHMLEKQADARPATMQAAMDEIAAAAKGAGVDIPSSAQASAMSPQPAHVAPAPTANASIAAGQAPSGQAVSGQGASPVMDTAAWLKQAAGMPSGAASGATGAMTGPPNMTGAGAGTQAGQAAQAQGQSGQHGQAPFQGQGQSPQQAQAQAPSPNYGPGQTAGGYGPGAQQGPSARESAGGWQPSHSPAPAYSPLAPPVAQGYPPGYANPTLQSAGNAPLPPKSSSPIGVIAAIGAGFLLLLVLSGGFYFYTFSKGVASAGVADIGVAVPPKGVANDRTIQTKLAVAFNAPGEPTPRITLEMTRNKWARVTVRDSSLTNATRVEVQYGQNELVTRKNPGGQETDISPSANRTFSVVAQGSGGVVSALDGSAVGQQEQTEVMEDVGDLLRPRTPMFGEMEQGHTTSPPSEAVVRLLGLGETEPGVHIRADNAVFRLVTFDPVKGTVTFDVQLLYVREEDTPALRLDCPLKGSVIIDEETGLVEEMSLSGPVTGTFSDAGARYNVSGTLATESH